MESEIIHGNKEREARNTHVPLDYSNPTTTHIAEEIKNNRDRIPFSRFMELSLFGQDGYYHKGDEAKGYITNPEYSEAVGAMIGETLRDIWLAMGRPENFQIIEIGAGDGSLPFSLLKWTNVLHPKFYDSIKYLIVEKSPDLISRQKNKLDHLNDIAYRHQLKKWLKDLRDKNEAPEFSGTDKIEWNKIEWINTDIFDLGLHDIEGVFISNCVPNTFPVELVKQIDGQVKQKFIGIDKDSNTWLEFWMKPTTEVLDYIKQFSLDCREDREIPININAARMHRQMAKSLKSGGIITMDYTFPQEAKETKDTLFRFHSGLVPIGDEDDVSIAYKYPGKVEITSPVEFTPLEQVIRNEGLKTLYLGENRTFLSSIEFRHKTIQKMLKRAQRVKSWKMLLEASRGIDFINLPREENIHVLFGTKNLDSTFKAKNIEQERLEQPLFPIKVGDREETVIVEFGPPYDVGYREAMRTDKEGTIFLPASRIEGLRVWANVRPDRIIPLRFGMVDQGSSLSFRGKASKDVLDRIVRGLGYF